MGRGAPLVGLNGLCIVGHGRSSAKAVANAVTMTVRAVNENLLGRLSQDLARSAQYYGRGMRAGTAEEREIWTLASLVADGSTGYGEALDHLLSRHLKATGDIDLATGRQLGRPAFSNPNITIDPAA